MAMCAGGGPQQTSPGGTDEGSSGDAILSGGATAADVANGLSNGLAMPTATVQTDPSAESASVPGAAGQSAAAAGAATADGAAAATAAAAAAPPPGAAVAQGSNGEQAAVGEGSAAVAVGVAAGGSDQKAGGTPSAAAASSALNAPAAPLPPALAVQQSATVAAGAVAAAAAGGSGGTSGAPAAAGQNEQRLEVAAAAVLVHAAGCKNPTCPVPHCNKMKKIHGHFLSCSTPDCGICKKLKPLTYIHAKHCVATPGEPCIIPYCNNAKKELQLLMQQRNKSNMLARQRACMPVPGGGGGGGAGGAGGGFMGGGAGGGAGGSGCSCAGGMAQGVAGANGLFYKSQPGFGQPDSVQAQAHYLLVLAHVMKCTNPKCAVAECAPTKALVTNHTRSCRAGDACTYPRCALSKRLMRHHRECPDQNCPICLPLRRRLAAAKMGSVASSVPGGEGGGAGTLGGARRKAKRKKGEDEEGEGGGGEGTGTGKRKKGRVGEGAAATGSNGHKLEGRQKKKSATAAEVAEQQVASEVDVLESGFSAVVHFATNARGRAASGELAGGDWRAGVVLRAYTVPQDPEPVYDVMMHSGVEEKAVQHHRCRMVCQCCLTDKRVFKPPPMFCEKCFAAIHTRWSYWEEGGDEGGVKLCKRCYSDTKASANPDRLLCELTHRTNLRIDSFIEKKERDRPEYVDNWVQCDECHSWLHWTCALYKGEDTPDDCLFFCETCRCRRGKQNPKELDVPAAEHLPENVLSVHLQKGLANDLAELGVEHEPVTIRVVSNVESKSKIGLQTAAAAAGAVGGSGASAAKAAAAPPAEAAHGKLSSEFPYRSKCILAFQKTHGHEVCFFALYVQEYGSDCPEPNTNRVYVSYLDSVRYFVSSPEGHRTTVYHSVLMNYLDYAKGLGFTHAHIWVSPPKQGDDYIFYAHPEAMLNKRMGLLKLKEWYERMLEVAKRKSIVVDFQDMLEEYKDIESASDIPVFSGDHWAASIALKIKDAQNKEKDAIKKKMGGAKPGVPLKAGAAAAAAASTAISTEKQEVQLLNQLTEEMRSMRNHFIVVTLLELKGKQQRAVIVDPVPLISNEFVDMRSSFLEKCQMYHWQFDEIRNAQHSTLMLLYHLHGMHKAARKRAALKAEAGAALANGGGGGSAAAAAPDPQRSRASKIEIAMQDWTQLLNHANQAALTETWELPPEELFLRILAQINRSKRDILQEKYNQCRDPSTTAATRSVFIRVLKRIAESFMSCLHTMQTGRQGVVLPQQPQRGISA